MFYRTEGDVSERFVHKNRYDLHCIGGGGGGGNGSSGRWRRRRLNLVRVWIYTTYLYQPTRTYTYRRTATAHSDYSYESRYIANTRASVRARIIISCVSCEIETLELAAKLERRYVSREYLRNTRGSISVTRGVLGLESFPNIFSQ